MKGGIMYADVVTTVSHRYAEEIQTLDYGWGLDEVLFQRHPRIFGIPNGLDWDAWNPESDSHLTARYTAAEAPEAKASNRTALREEFGLPDDPGVPLVGIVSRLVDQKGFDLIEAIAGELRELPLQVVVLGTGHPRYEQLFRELAANTANVRARIGFDVALSHRIYTGADFFLMPSAFEPGGLGQLIALRYGTLPIVHATGGLADTVAPYVPGAKNGKGTGFVFESPHPEVLFTTILLALQVFRDKEEWKKIMLRGMRQDFSWRNSAQEYVKLYERALALNQASPARPVDTFPRMRFRGAGPL